MRDKEAKARIKINRLLEEAGWRFFDDENGKANIALENHIRFEELGDDFEKTTRGFIDFLLLDEKGKPILVLEAKKAAIHPLAAKEQARNYAIAQKVNYIILSNGDLHFLWNIESGNPEPIFSFPTQASFKKYSAAKPDVNKLIEYPITPDFIATTQLPDYLDFPDYKNEVSRPDFLKKYGLKFLRYYQINAILSIQQKIREGNIRFLFEMATGTGKTLTAAAVIKLFYKTGNASRILFLVDRLELEDQARKDFDRYLKPDIKTIVYKENRDDWRKAEIVVTTIQSLLVNNMYKSKFSPTDFDLVISDEAHRLIGGGNSRALFEYFLGYKLGLTATPKDYLKNYDSDNPDDPKEFERRLLLDTYKTFGCGAGTPTFRYTLVDGAKDGILVQPYKIDARTTVTTKLLSEAGYSVLVKDSTDEESEASHEVIYQRRDFEKKFFSDPTNKLFVKTLVDNGLHDPITNEFGKTLVFTVSQKHAAKITQLLCEYAHTKWPGKYQSDFAIQVTSWVKGSQDMTSAFSNDKLNGFSKWAANVPELESYKTSKARVCVTVGMMTTGWDCPNLLNIAFMRPVFSPAEFIQMKGRGTRIHSFEHHFKNSLGETETIIVDKQHYKLFDFFAVCEYFEEKYDYTQQMELPKEADPTPKPGQPGGTVPREYDYQSNDFIDRLNEEQVGVEGMKVDRMLYQHFEDDIKADADIVQEMETGNVDVAAGIILEKYLDQPTKYITLEKLRKALQIDRKITVRELLEMVFYGNAIKGKEDLLNEEFEKFIANIDTTQITDFAGLRYFFLAYITDENLRRIIDQQDFTELYHNPTFNVEDFNRVDDEMKHQLPYYVNTYVPINKFIS